MLKLNKIDKTEQNSYFKLYITVLLSIFEQINAALGSIKNTKNLTNATFFNDILFLIDVTLLK